MPGDVTLGEVSRKLDDLAGEVKGIGAQLGDRPDWRDIQRVENDLKDKIEKLDHQLTELKDWKDWAVRIVLGAVVTAVIAAYFIIKP